MSRKTSNQLNKEKRKNEVILQRKETDWVNYTYHLKENQLLFLSILCSAASFDFTDSTFAWARNLNNDQEKGSPLYLMLIITERSINNQNQSRKPNLKFKQDSASESTEIACIKTITYCSHTEKQEGSCSECTIVDVYLWKHFFNIYRQLYEDLDEQENIENSLHHSLL